MSFSCSLVGSCVFCNGQPSTLTVDTKQSFYNQDKDESQVLAELQKRVLEGFDPCELVAENKSSMLMHAVIAGRNGVVSWLVDHIRARGCQEHINLQCDTLGQTALHFACARGNLTAMKILLENGASPEITDHHGASPLHVAASCGHKEVVKRLAEMDKTTTKVHLNAKFGPQRITALHAACMYGHNGVAKALIKAGASIEAVDSCGCVPLHSAVFGNNLKSVSLLIDRIVTSEKRFEYLNTKTGFFRITPLHLASEWGHVEIVRKLLDSGASLSLRSAIDETPFHTATRCCKIEVLTELISSVPETSRDELLNDRCGIRILTPLHIASAVGDLRTVNWLIDHGAFLAFLDADGNTPAEVAEKCGNHAVAELLNALEFPLYGA
ncbi:MAG: ankyrin repeat domain-containing protein [Chlamydiota bacterium]